MSIRNKRETRNRLLSFRIVSKFRPNFYDLLLISINMPMMNGFEFSGKILDLDIDPRICFMSSGLINQEALREQYNTTLSVGCFIRTPVTIEHLIKRVKVELGYDRRSKLIDCLIPEKNIVTYIAI